MDFGILERISRLFVGAGSSDNVEARTGFTRVLLIILLGLTIFTLIPVVQTLNEFEAYNIKLPTPSGHSGLRSLSLHSNETQAKNIIHEWTQFERLATAREVLALHQDFIPEYTRFFVLLAVGACGWAYLEFDRFGSSQRHPGIVDSSGVSDDGDFMVSLR